VSWWWADCVDRRLSLRLQECRTWLRNGTYDDFAVTLVVPMSGDDGNWAVWIRLSPVGRDLGGGLRVLVDSDGQGFGVPLTLGRGPEAPAPGTNRHTVAIVAGFDDDILPITADTIDYSCIRMILRGGAGTENRRRWAPDIEPGGGMARELCERYDGENLRRTADGLWSFTLRT
jgi:hypothetical protein